LTCTSGAATVDWPPTQARRTCGRGERYLQILSMTSWLTMAVRSARRALTTWAAPTRLPRSRSSTTAYSTARATTSTIRATA
jgi:hypothetical protein